MSWREDAACAGIPVGLFYLEVGNGDPSEAKAVCASCVVREECLSHAVSAPEVFGVWGGLAPKKRRPLRRAALGGV